MPMNRSMRLATTGLALAGSVAAVLWFFARPEPVITRTLLRPDDAKLVQHGEQVYRAHCASCHGVDLRGQAHWRVRGADGRLPAPPHDDTGHTWHHPDELLFRLTKDGVSKTVGMAGYASNMPAFGDRLGDADIVTVLSWIKSRWPPAIQDKHDQINRQASQAPQR